MQKIELLAPAQNLECGLAAINCGADAVYIGAERFGAREKAGNSLKDIGALVNYAHRYWANVYVTLNTLLRDDELPQAVRLIHRLHEVGVDGLIIQDTGLLECDLPPLPLIASTQMHNHTPERVAFLQKVGFSRVILPRELSLDEIRTVRERTTVDLEFFVHGALCVCYSGQCCMSYAIGRRSGNRGECAQPCRRRYSLLDGNGKVLVKDRYLLSLRDLNLSEHLTDLVDAGISSFKIEGRLKNKAYVMNAVSAYRRRIDRILNAKKGSRSSSGKSRIDFTPDLNKTFNRGYTSYFMEGRKASPAAPDTPKMTGERLGKVRAVNRNSFTLDAASSLHNGDGLCFFNSQQVLRGTVVNSVRGNVVYPNRIQGIRKGMVIYRNHDHVFLKQLEKSGAERSIAVRFRLEDAVDGFRLSAVDEDGNSAADVLIIDKIEAEKPQLALNTIRRQLRKTGGTEFYSAGLEIDLQTVYHIPLASLNALRRSVLEKLSRRREQNRPALPLRTAEADVPYPEKRLSYIGNVLNTRAEAFYRRHGVAEIEAAAESGLDMRGRQVMRTRYCIRHQLGLCRRGKKSSAPAEPLWLVDENGHQYRLQFDCSACEMSIFF